MKQFEYIAVDQNRNKISGKFIAKDENDLAVQLSKQNLYLISASLYSGNTPSAFFTLGIGKIEDLELAMFCRQFSIMYNAGVSIIEILDVLTRKTISSYFKKILIIINNDIKSGIMFYEAVVKHKKAFPAFFCNMVKVGELSGKLDTVFESLAEYYEKEQKIKQNLRAALSYPIMLMGMTLGIVILMMLYIVPTFRKSLRTLKVEATGLTQIVYNLSDFFLANWLNILAILLIVVGLLILFGFTSKGKYFYGYLKVRLPLFRQINIDIVSARFARSFALLLNSGLDTTESLVAAQTILLNPEVTARYNKAVAEIRLGASMSDSFSKYKIFPDIMLQMLSVGEKTGSVAEVLSKSCAFYDAQSERTVASVTSKIQPIILVILGVILALLFIAIYSPMISIMNGLIP